MRYCLACRYISGDGPLCTRCGRSFGGKLCHGKKRHLNPPDALYCGQCGSQNLTDAADYIALGCPAKLLLFGAAIGALWLGGSFLLQWSGWGFTALTGYASLAVWVIEKSAHVLIILFIFYFLSGLIPGEAGRQFRKLLAQLSGGAVKLLFSTLEKTVSAILRGFGGKATKH